MVESSGLLNRRTVKNCTGGSNPPLSASLKLSKPTHRNQGPPARQPLATEWRFATHCHQPAGRFEICHSTRVPHTLRIPHLIEGPPLPRIGARGGFLILPGHEVTVLRDRERRLAVAHLELTVLISTPPGNDWLACACRKPWKFGPASARRLRSARYAPGEGRGRPH